MKVFKKLLTIICTVFMLVACSSANKTAESTEGTKTEESKLKNVMFVVTGSLGGGTNNDDVYAAISDYVKGVGGNVDTFECNMDTSLYETALMQASETGEYDLIVTGFGTMIEPLSKTAEKFPNQKYLIFDTEMKYEDGKNQNVVSVQVLQNQGGFLAGVLAAKTTLNGAKLSNEDKKVGFVGAMESTAILDFLMGYIEGVNYVDSSIEVLYSFVGNHTDTALAKELGLSQYQQGADVIFAVGGNGMGVAEAALDADKYVIGVDFDYAARLEKTSPETASHVITSVIKDYRGMVYPILESIGNGSVEWGKHSYISFKDGGVYLIENSYTTDIISEEILKEYKEISEKLANGEIEVPTAFNASTSEIDAAKEKAKAH